MSGTSNVAFRQETSFNEPDAEGTWYQPGMNIEVGDLSISNELQRNRHPDQVAPEGSREGNALGTASVSWDLTDDNFHDLLPFENGSLVREGGPAPTAEWYFSTTALDDAGSQFSASVTAAGAAITQVDIQYQQGQNNRANATIEFGLLSDNSPGDGEIVKPSNADIYTHHGTDLTVGTRGQSGMQSATLTLSNLARRQEHQERGPRNMVIGAVEPEFQSDAIFSEVDQLEAATGGSTTSIGDLIDGEDGEFSLENGQAETISYGLKNMQPNNYQWAALVDADTDLTEPITYHVANVEV